MEKPGWKVQDAGELAYSQLERRLSRSGVKETTLDYTRDFAERRGIAVIFQDGAAIAISRREDFFASLCKLERR